MPVESTAVVLTRVQSGNFLVNVDKRWELGHAKLLHVGQHGRLDHFDTALGRIVKNGLQRR